METFRTGSLRAHFRRLPVAPAVCSKLLLAPVWLWKGALGTPRQRQSGAGLRDKRALGKTQVGPGGRGTWNFPWREYKGKKAFCGVFSQPPQEQVRKHRRWPTWVHFGAEPAMGGPQRTKQARAGPALGEKSSEIFAICSVALGTVKHQTGQPRG